MSQNTQSKDDILKVISQSWSLTRWQDENISQTSWLLQIIVNKCVLEDVQMTS